MSTWIFYKRLDEAIRLLQESTDYLNEYNKASIEKPGEKV
jgi:hypothetical protein